MAMLRANQQPRHRKAERTLPPFTHLRRRLGHLMFGPVPAGNGGRPALANIGQLKASSARSSLGSSIWRAGHHILQRQQVSALQARTPKLSTSPGDRTRPSRPLQVAVASNSSRTVTFIQRLNGTLIRNDLALPQGEYRHAERLPSGGAVQTDRLANAVTCR